MEEKEYQLELKKISLAKARIRFDLMKWGIIAVGAIISFWVIDYGNLKLEKYRAQSLNERELLISYMDAMGSSAPEVWKRKLNFLLEYSNDQKIRNFANNQLNYINEYAELNALYRETIKIASSLSVKEGLGDNEKRENLLRFEQLYWAELPLAGESEIVSKAMIQYRVRLQKVEAEPNEAINWNNLNLAMLELSTAIRSSMPNKLLQPTTEVAAEENARQNRV
ncbi:MAG: hypothetical protein Tsb002_20570 [Wenzhouxiangellaceae bacterium]